MEDHQHNQDIHSPVFKVYSLLLLMLAATIGFWFIHVPNPPPSDTAVHQSATSETQEVASTQNSMSSKRVIINDAKLRRISISARHLVLESHDGKFKFNQDMLEFIRAIRNKYRVYLLTNLEPDYKKEQLEQIQELLGKLVKQDIIKGKQRLMYSSTEVGHVAQIRHLAADLHLESDFNIVKSLNQFMNKFHLICPQNNTAEIKDEIQTFVKSNPKKILYFEDIISYTTKIKNALSK